LALIWAVEALGGRSVVVGTLDEVSRLDLGGAGRVVFVTDQYTDAKLVARARAKFPRGKRYDVDFWGTPAAQARRGSAPADYIVPYPYPCGNTWIGFRSEDAAFRSRPPAAKGRTVVVMGKEAKYFTAAAAGALAAVAALPGVSEVVATVVAGGAASARLPRTVRNAGLLDAAAYAALLGDAAVVVGLGDPVLGPAALDALEHGAALVLLRYPTPRAEKYVNPRLPWRTQHDFADAIGPPWVVAAPFSQYPARVAAALALQAATPVVGSRLPAAYGDAAILERARAWLATAS